jgi:hypothetical protein
LHASFLRPLLIRSSRRTGFQLANRTRITVAKLSLARFLSNILEKGTHLDPKSNTLAFHGFIKSDKSPTGFILVFTHNWRHRVQESSHRRAFSGTPRPAGVPPGHTRPVAPQLRQNFASIEVFACLQEADFGALDDHEGRPLHFFPLKNKYKSP